MNPEEKKRMGMRIRACRLDIDLSQESLAEKLGMKRTNIANYEAGRVVPPGNVILDMAEILGVTTDYILGRTDDPSQQSEPLESSLRQIQRARKRLPNVEDRKRMDRMVEMIKLSFVDAFNEEEDEDDEDDL
jgi:transcriptional regulator with XRE-family HTH domain